MISFVIFEYPLMKKFSFPLLLRHRNLAYLDNASTTQKPRKVINRLSNFYKKENANVHRGIYQLSENSTREYELARGTIKNFINANSTKEIVFTSGTTESINLVGYSWIWLNVFEGDTILATQMEHHANLILWQQAAKLKKDVTFDLVDVDSSYKLDLVDLEQKLAKYQPKLLAVTHASNVLGTITPIKKIVEIKSKVSPNTRIHCRWGTSYSPHSS